mmetsp:Transcript_26975/g.41110  ORF Transcript_26975/g.41110 Transcript_26975/m.41110 type:complete len:256 (-) Transcript_26975:147-914(-)
MTTLRVTMDSLGWVEGPLLKTAITARRSKRFVVSWEISITICSLQKGRTTLNGGRCSFWATLPSTKENGLKELKSEKVKVFRSGPTALCTRDGSRTTRPTASADSSTLTEMSISDSGRMTKHTAREPTVIWTEPSTKEIGAKTSSTATVLKLGSMVPNTKASMSMARSTDEASSPGRTAATSRVHSRAIISMVLVNMSGPTRDGTKVPGSTTKWTEKVDLFGQMDGLTMASTLTTRSTATASSPGPTAVATRAAG